MKKNILTWAAAALVLAACSNHEENNEWAGEIRLSSELTVQQTTRAATDIQSSQFDSGEQIDVYISEQTSGGQASTIYDQPLVYTTGNNGAMTPPAGKQPYFPTSGNGVDIYAVYPSGAGTTFSVQTDQRAVGAYKASDLMRAQVSTPPINSIIPLAFSHLLSKVTVKLSVGEGSPNLADAVVTLTDVLPTTTFTAATGSIGTASGTATAITVMENATAGSAIVVPQTLGTNFITVQLKDGAVLKSKNLTDATGTPITDVVLDGGYEYTYDITVNLTSLDVKASINKWQSGNGGKGEAEML